MTDADIKLIKEALWDVERCEMRAIDALPDVDTSFFPDYDRKVKEAERNAKRRTVRLPARKWVAVLIAAALLLCMGVTTFAFREDISGFVEEVFEGFTRLFSDAPNEARIEDEGVYHPTYLPGEYEETSFSKLETHVQTTWIDGKDRIILNQNTVGGQSITYDTEDSTYEQLSVGNLTYHYVAKNGMHLLIWSTEKYSFSLICTSGITKEQALDVASSLSILPEEEVSKREAQNQE